MHYRTNFLTKVVLRLNFDPIPALRDNARLDNRPGFSARIAEQFPIVRGQPTASLNVNIGPLGAGLEQQMTGVIWDHRRVENGTQVAVLSSDSVGVEYGKNDFDHFPPFRAHARLVIDSLIAEYNPPQFTRLGLRYINEIVLPEGNPLDWDGILQPDLITATKVASGDERQIVRSMHQGIFSSGEYTTVFNYGLVNPDFPNALARRVFVLDYDCSRNGPIPAGEVLQSLDAANVVCESLFEDCIGERLRERMGVIDD